MREMHGKRHRPAMLLSPFSYDEKRQWHPRKIVERFPSAQAKQPKAQVCKSCESIELVDIGVTDL